jgi:hypothetical protein
LTLRKIDLIPFSGLILLAGCLLEGDRIAGNGSEVENGITGGDLSLVSRKRRGMRDRDRTARPVSFGRHAQWRPDASA